MFLGLIAWKVIVNPSGKGFLSIISGALRKAFKKKNHECELHSDSEWDGFDDEKKLTEVLHHVIKINDAPNADQSQGNQSQGNQSQGNQNQGNQRQGNQSQGNDSQPPPQGQ